MQHQQACAQVKQQILATPANRQHALPHQLLWFAAQRPAQRLAHAGSVNVGTSNALGKTQAGDFDFGQFGHKETNTFANKNGARSGLCKTSADALGRKRQKRLGKASIIMSR